MLLLAHLVEAADQWIRLDNPSPQLKRELADVAIEYPNFLWLAESQLPSQSVITDTSVHVVSHPFNFTIDNLSIDIRQPQWPNNVWFFDHSLSRGVNTPQLFIVQFDGPLKNKWLSDLKQKHIKPIKPLAPFSWIVSATPQQQGSLKQLAGIRASHYLVSALRVAKHNRSLSADRIASMALVVTEQLAQSQAELIQLGALIHSTVSIDKNLSAINFIFPGSQYQAAAEIPGLLTIQKVATDGGPRGEMSQQSIVGAYNGALTVVPGYQSWLTAAGVDGSGVTVGVVDGGIFNNHPDLVGQFISCSGPGPSCGNTTDDHGTHVAGAIAGTGVNNAFDSGGFNRGLGVAPGVRIVEQLYEPLTDPGQSDGMIGAGAMLSIYKDSQISGALLTNNSWGPTGSPQGYDIPTMEIDMIARDANPDIPGNQPVMPVWSIMNGNGDWNSSACAPSSLGSPDEAKNLFAVGSTKLQSGTGSQLNALFDVSYNSAHGPACDGRLVPHIVAPGCSTDAPDSSTGYDLMCGTSMASPVISGAVSLYWEQYKNSHGVDPSSALIKAVFMAKADDLAGFNDANGNVMGHAPDRKQGWGRVNLDKIINPTEQLWLIDQQTLFTNSGNQYTVQLTPANPAEAVKIMLVWTDAPGAGLGGSNPAWVNDLDLSVNSGANTYFGNQFGFDGFSVTGGSPDRKNNMEAVFLKATQHSGNPFTIEVLAANIMGDALNPHNPTTNRQDFALVCDNCVAQILPDLIFKNGFEDPDIIFKDGFE
ncbi:MAG: hypothetical protein DWP95_05065 [Proteobacteria bacterium]|nr:MAG: hypothetical protein DWP95_05065 [Pseudomonadota bacterium]